MGVLGAIALAKSDKKMPPPSGQGTGAKSGPNPVGGFSMPNVNLSGSAVAVKPGDAMAQQKAFIHPAQSALEAFKATATPGDPATESQTQMFMSLYR